MKHKKRLFWLLLLPVLLIPVHVHMTDGGSEGWHAILWQLDHCHEFSKNGFLVGTRVSLLFGLIPVYDDTHEEPMEPEPMEAPAPAETRSDVPEPTADAAPYLVEEESFFSDFVIQKDAVYGADEVVFLCRLTIRNPSDTPAPVKISGDFSADAEAGLIWGQGLYALRLDEGAGADFLDLDAAERDTILRDRSRLLFLLQPGDNAFWVAFSGLHGESSVKQDRLLPKIRLSPLADVTPEEVSAAMDCRIVKDPVLCDAFLLDGEEIFGLGVGFFGGYGFTSAVPFDYGFNEVPDLLFTYSFGSGMHRSHLALFDRTTKEEQELYIYYPTGAERDLVVELEQDGYPAVVYTADVTAKGYGYSDLRFTKRERAGVVVFVLSEDEALSGPRFVPDEDFHDLSYMPEAVPVLGTAAAAQPRSCTVFYGGGEAEVDGATAAELYRICREAEAQGTEICAQEHELVQQEICLTFRSEFEGRSWEGPWYAVRKDDICSTGASIYASFARDLQLPAGTYEALLERLTQDGVLPMDLGECIEGNEVYAVFEKAGLYTVQLYDREGGLVWCRGPFNKVPDVLQEELDLWSVSFQGGTGLSTRWTVYYAPADGRLSPYWYGVLDRQGDRLVRMAAYQHLEVCGLFESGPGALISAWSFSQAPSNAAETFVSACFSEDGKSLAVTYLAGEDYHEATETVPLP